MLFSYVIETYGKEYILKLINNENFLMSETSKLYEEFILYTNKKKRK